MYFEPSEVYELTPGIDQIKFPYPHFLGQHYHMYTRIVL